jgi:crotonobetaine/carnitine-CoA ligase
MPDKTSYFSDRETVVSLLEGCARRSPDHVVCRAADVALTYAQLNERVNRAAHGLQTLGIARGTRVAVMLAHHLDHLVTFLALMKLAAIQIPVNVHLRGAGLAYIFDHSEPAVAIVDDEFAEALAEIVTAKPALRVAWRRGAGAAAGERDLATLYASGDADNPEVPVFDGDIRSIVYTSGTTGAAKGVVMTDRMYRAAALGSIWIGDIAPGSVLHFWDPIYHVFGREVVVLALMVPVTLTLVPRFSASQLWDEARRYGATHIHFVGGVLQLLLKQPPRPDDRRHGVRIAWGGGCPVEVWREFESRFGVPIHEGYGMTETSSFSVINTEGKLGSIGKAVPYFDVEIVDEAGQRAAPGTPGEIRVAAREPGVLLSEYYRDPITTAATLRDGWLYTGDLAYADADGFLFFLGRKKDSLRRRGENISAWEVERVVNEHPLVEESALVGVKNEFSDEDLKLFVKPRDARLTAAALIAWCQPRMAAFQVPRFVAFVDAFRKTPTQRIQKQFLSRTIDDCWDREKTGDAPAATTKP